MFKGYEASNRSNIHGDALHGILATTAVCSLQSLSTASEATSESSLMTDDVSVAEVCMIGGRQGPPAKKELLLMLVAKYSRKKNLANQPKR